MKMAGIVFGEDYVKDNPVLAAITNCNSPLVWDATMLDAMKVYARHNQPVILAPFALCGASTSASAVGAVAQVNAEALAGVAFTQLVRPGFAADLWAVHGHRRHEDRRADGRHAGGRADDVSDGRAGAEIPAALAHLRLPCRIEAERRAGGLRVEHADARGHPGRRQLHLACGRVAGGRHDLRLFEIRDGLRAARRLVQICRRRFLRRLQGRDGGGARGRARPGTSSARNTRSTISRRRSSCRASWTSTPSSSGMPKAPRTTTRAAAKKPRAMLRDYEEPKLDEGVAEGCATSSPCARNSCRTL